MTEELKARRLAKLKYHGTISSAFHHTNEAEQVVQCGLKNWRRHSDKSTAFPRASGPSESQGARRSPPFFERIRILMEYRVWPLPACHEYYNRSPHSDAHHSLPQKTNPAFSRRRASGSLVRPTA